MIGSSGEGISIGDSVTLFADSLFGFIHGAVSEDLGESLVVRPLEERYNFGDGMELFQVHVRHEYDAQERLQEFLQAHQLQHPADAERVLGSLQLQHLAELQGLAESEMTNNSENQRFQVGRSLFIGQVFQLLHVKTSNFVTIDSSSGRLVYLSEGGGGSLLRMRTSANNASNLMVLDQDRVWIESTQSCKAIGCSPHAQASSSGAWRAVAVSGAKESLQLTLSLHSKAKQNFGGREWTSLEQATCQARGFLEDSRQNADRSRARLANEIASLDGMLSDAQRGFDETVLMVMLHFQNLHQALETRENLILSQARALHSARCDQATHARQQLEAAHQQEEEGVELAGRVLGVASDAELLQLAPHAQRKLESTCSGDALNLAMESKKNLKGDMGFSCHLDDSLLATISLHGSIIGASAQRHSNDRGSLETPHSRSSRRKPITAASSAIGCDINTTGMSSQAIREFHDDGKSTNGGSSSKGMANAARPAASARPSTGPPGPHKSSSSGSSQSSKPHVAIHERMTVSTLYRQCTPSRKPVAFGPQ